MESYNVEPFGIGFYSLSLHLSRPMVAVVWMGGSLSLPGSVAGVHRPHFNIHP